MRRSRIFRFTCSKCDWAWNVARPTVSSRYPIWIILWMQISHQLSAKTSPLMLNKFAITLNPVPHFQAMCERFSELPRQCLLRIWQLCYLRSELSQFITDANNRHRFLQVTIQIPYINYDQTITGWKRANQTISGFSSENLDIRSTLPVLTKSFMANRNKWGFSSYRVHVHLVIVMDTFRLNSFIAIPGPEFARNSLMDWLSPTAIAVRMEREA